MKLSTIRSALAGIGMHPTRSLGQNFLHDQNLAEWIVGEMDLRPEESWIELGPGLGALTEFAFRRSKRGIAIEKDQRLVEFLRAGYPQLEVVHGDATEFDVRDLFERGPTKVLGNLPYYVSSQILFSFGAEPSPVSAMIFTLQRELAERLSAPPRTKEYGALTLLLGRRWRVKYLRTLPGSVFHPAPTIESGVVLLTPRVAGELPECNGERFISLVKQGFSQRRKQLRKMLASYSLDWPLLTSTLAVPETVRAEELSIEQWIALTNFVTKRPIDATAAQDIHGEIFDVVDEFDHVVAQASRHEVHTRKLLHRAVHIFVINRAGDLFLQKRSRFKDMHPSRWDSSAAGHVNAGQEYDATAPRELVEELGVVAALEAIGTIPPSAATGWEHVRLYRAFHDGPFALHPAEIETGGFFTLNQIARWSAARPQDFASGFLECFRCYMSREAGATT